MKNKINTISLSSLRNFKSRFNLFLLMLCSFVGVGFVSGAEIFEFFVRFGACFWLGILLFFVLVLLITYKMLKLSKISYIGLKNTILENNLQLKINTENTKNSKKERIKTQIRETVFGVNALMIASAMFSGLKYFLHDLFSEHFTLIYCIGLLIVFLILIFGVKYLSKFDYFVLGFVLVLFVYYIFNLNSNFSLNLAEFDIKNAFFSLFFASLYVFMNLFGLKPLIDLSDAKFSSKKGLLIFSLIFASAMTILLIVFSLTLFSNSNVLSSSMPFLEYFKQRSGTVQLLFCFGLVISILSTQVSSLIGFKNKLSCVLKTGNLTLSIISFLICFLLGFIPFKFFVSFVYPVLGLINFLSFVFC